MSGTRATVFAEIICFTFTKGAEEHLKDEGEKEADRVHLGHDSALHN